MSRMTKFLRQTCKLQAYERDVDGSAKMNEFGELIYKPSITVKCRHEDTHRDVQTQNGSIIRSMSRYFLDGSNEVVADFRIDGKVVISVESYVNSVGKIEGYEVYV